MVKSPFNLVIFQLTKPQVANQQQQKILSLAGILTHKLQGTKPMHNKLSYPGLDYTSIVKCLNSCKAKLVAGMWKQ